MIDWASKHTELVGTSATGANLTLRDEIAAELATVGAKYDPRFAESGVDVAKTAWTNSATSAFDDAEQAAAYVYEAESEPTPADLTFDPYSVTEIAARLVAARALTSDAALLRILDAHQDAFFSIFLSTVGAYKEPKPRPHIGTFGGDASFDLSVWDLEVQLTQKIADAHALIGLVT